jgi:CBS domain-containing protein
VKVREAMADKVEMVPADATVQEAAQAMAEFDAEALPVGADGVVQGMLTDRDILIRVVAEGLDPKTTPARTVMSTDLLTCGPDDDVEEAANTMEGRRIRHLPVVDERGRLVGMVALARHAPDGVVARESAPPAKERRPKEPGGPAKP